MSEYMLGSEECDEETAYFMKHGKPKPYKKPTCKYGEPEQWEIEDRTDPDQQYICWQGTQIPSWLQ